MCSAFSIAKRFQLSAIWAALEIFCIIIVVVVVVVTTIIVIICYFLLLLFFYFFYCRYDYDHDCESFSDHYGSSFYYYAYYYYCYEYDYCCEYFIIIGSSSQ